MFLNIFLGSVPLKLPTQPLPPQHQPAPVQQQTKSNNLDVLAQTLKLSEISSDLDFDFEPAEPVRLGGGSSMIPPEETQVRSLKLSSCKNVNSFQAMCVQLYTQAYLDLKNVKFYIECLQFLDDLTFDFGMSGMRNQGTL